MWWGEWGGAEGVEVGAEGVEVGGVRWVRGEEGQLKNCQIPELFFLFLVGWHTPFTFGTNYPQVTI